MVPSRYSAPNSEAIQRLSSSGSASLVEHHAEAADAQIGRHLANAHGGLHAALAGLDHHHHQVNAHGGAAAQVLDAGFHVENDDFAVAQHQVRDQALQQHAFGTGATAGRMFHRAQHQQVDSLVRDRVFLGDIGDFGIDLEHLAELLTLAPVRSSISLRSVEMV